MQLMRHVLCYLVCSCHVRCEAFYKAYEAPDSPEYPNLLLTAKYGLDVVVFDARTPDSVLQFLILVSAPNIVLLFSNPCGVWSHGSW